MARRRVFGRQLEPIVSRQDPKHDVTRTNAKITLGDRHCGYTLIRWRLQRQSTAGAAPSLCTNPTGQNYPSMTVPIHTEKDAQQTWLMDFLSSNITISGRQRRAIARSDHQSEIQMHGDAHSHRKSIRRDNVSENGVRSTHLEN